MQICVIRRGGFCYEAAPRKSPLHTFLCSLISLHLLWLQMQKCYVNQRTAARKALPPAKMPGVYQLNVLFQKHTNTISEEMSFKEFQKVHTGQIQHVS